MVEQIEGLRLELQLHAFADRKTARQPNVDSLQPWAVERIDADAGSGSGTVDAAGGGGGVLVEGGVVQIVAAGCGA